MATEVNFNYINISIVWCYYMFWVC